MNIDIVHYTSNYIYNNTSILIKIFPNMFYISGIIQNIISYSAYFFSTFIFLFLKSCNEQTLKFSFFSFSCFFFF